MGVLVELELVLPQLPDYLLTHFLTHALHLLTELLLTYRVWARSSTLATPIQRRAPCQGRGAGARRRACAMFSSRPQAAYLTQSP